MKSRSEANFLLPAPRGGDGMFRHLFQRDERDVAGMQDGVVKLPKQAQQLAGAGNAPA